MLRVYSVYLKFRRIITSYRKEQLRRLQNEVIEIEDLKTGVSITDLGLNDFRIFYQLTFANRIKIKAAYSAPVMPMPANG